VSLTPLNRFQRCHWHRWNFRPDPHSCFLGVIDTAEIVSAVSLTPRKPIQRCQWHRWNRFSSIIDTAETLDLILIAVSAEIYMTPLKL
jgi:hypothetical protein